MLTVGSVNILLTNAVTSERVSLTPKGLKLAVCLEGANACPPEDEGGSRSYEHLLAVLADSTHEEHEDLKGWLGRPIDPTAFEMALFQAQLQAVR